MNRASKTLIAAASFGLLSTAAMAAPLPDNGPMDLHQPVASSVERAAVRSEVRAPAQSQYVVQGPLLMKNPGYVDNGTKVDRAAVRAEARHALANPNRAALLSKG